MGPTSTCPPQQDPSHGTHAHFPRSCWDLWLGSLWALPSPMAWAAGEQPCLPLQTPCLPQVTPFIPEQIPGGAQVCPPPLQHTTLGNSRHKKESTGATGRAVGQGNPPIRGEEPELWHLPVPSSSLGLCTCTHRLRSRERNKTQILNK